MKRSLSISTLALALLLLDGVPCRATFLTYDIVPGQGSADFLFDPSLGVLSSMWIEYEYSTVAAYSNFGHSQPLGQAIVHATWYDTTTLVVWNGTVREFRFDWLAHGWGNNAPTGLESFFVTGSTGNRSMKYSGADIPELFLASGDERGSLVTLTENSIGIPKITPEFVVDSNGNYYVIDMAALSLETLRVTYLYDTPEPSTWVLLGLGALGLSGRLGRRRNRTGVTPGGRPSPSPGPNETVS